MLKCLLNCLIEVCLDKVMLQVTFLYYSTRQAPIQKVSKADNKGKGTEITGDYTNINNLENQKGESFLFTF